MQYLRLFLALAFCWMTQAQAQETFGNYISHLPPAAFVGPTDQLYTRQGGVSKQLNAASLFPVLSIDSFGAKHDGVTDDTPALIAAELALGTGAGFGHGGGYIQLTCSNTYLFATNHTIPANVIVRHCNPALVFGDGASGAPYASQGHINLSATWTLFNNSGVLDAVILNPSCTFPAGSLTCYTGTALALPNFGAAKVADVIVNALVVGYKTCFDGTYGGHRLNLILHCDANGTLTTDAAIIIGNSDDRGTFVLDTFPYGTTEQAFPILTRTGIGIHLLAGNTAGMLFPRLFDLGHTNGVVLEGAGGIEVGSLWTDTNSSWGVIINGMAGGATFHTVYAYTGGGVRVQNAAGQGIRIDYMFCNSLPSPPEVCMQVDAGHVGMGEFDIAGNGSYGLVLTSSTAKVDIQTINWAAVNNSTAPYIAFGFANGSCNQLSIAQRRTDLPVASSLIGANACLYPTVASATALQPPTDTDLLQVTGTTTINTIQGVWGNRQLILEFAGAVTVNDKSTAGGNIALAGSTNFVSTAGSILVLNYDQNANLWRQVSSSKP